MRSKSSHIPMCGITPLTAIQQRWVEEYCVDFNDLRASRAVGFRRPMMPHFSQPQFAMLLAAVQMRLMVLAERSVLNGDYVREYIKTVLEFSPIDFFQPAPEGGWMIAEDQFQHIPHTVKRLVESIEYRKIRGQDFLAITFISKTAALAMAAKYTLTQNINATVSQVPWEEMTRNLEEQAMDSVEKRLESIIGPDKTKGPSAPGQAAVA